MTAARTPVQLAGVSPSAPGRDETAWRAGFVLLAAGLFGLYLLDPPNVPDLAAQTARAEAAKDGAYLWWTGWFGGVVQPSYSVFSPFVMAKIGVGLSAALAGVAACAAAPVLFEGTRRPRAASAVFGVGVLLNVLGGRVTFALGFAAAVIAAALLRRRRAWWAGAAGVAACLLSPLAGLWLGLIAVTVAIVDTSRRRAAVGVSAALVGVALTLALVFRNSGPMAFPWWHVAMALCAIAGVLVACQDRAVRVGALLFGLAVVAFAVVPTAVGTNMMRLVWLTAGPVVVATGTIAVGRVALRRTGVALLTVGALLWPTVDLSLELAKASSPAASPAYYAPLVEELGRQARAAGPAALGQRLEIIDPASHWSAAYVAPTVPIARGWDRQADRAANPLFYDGTLTADSYRTWLHELAVRWVALPSEGSLDYAAQAEADLVRSGLPYLTPVWSNASWQLFQVTDAAPLVRGAQLVELDASEITFVAPQAGPVHLQIRWSPLLALTGAGGETGCVRERGPWTSVDVTSPGTYTLVSKLALPTGDDRTDCN
ncbi:MFS transporter [Sporichthya brevicatena]|uniref:MFS transporter n=1 Tax=Sporichthya brevicatena TaxID=171442 RepID=A0ABN1G3B3_9ACTN